MRTVNISGKNIREFSNGDTIYIRKTRAGHSNIYFCKFKEYKRGVVTGEIIEADTNPQLHKSETGKTISARLANCCLWGKREEQSTNWDCCHWFKKDGYID